METLQTIDTYLFFLFNVHFSNPVFDAVMPFITNKLSWLPVWIAAIVFLLWKGGKEGRVALIALLLTVAVTDLFTNQLLKPLIHRMRPCAALEGVHLLVKCIHSPSMPSSHASNFFAVATVFSFYLKKYRWVFWSLAALVAYSRVAVGVHYPGDVLAGAAVGWACGQLGVWIYRKYGISKPDDVRNA